MSSRPRRRLASGIAASALAASFGLVACGGAAPDAQAPMAPGYAPEGAAAVSPRSADEAAGELDRAERELSAALGQARRDVAKDPSPTAPIDGAVPPSGAETTLSSGNPCFVACRALGSMQRAADHLCELSGDGDARCTDARDRVRTATDFVRERCPACN